MAHNVPLLAELAAIAIRQFKYRYIVHLYSIADWLVSFRFVIDEITITILHFFFSPAFYFVLI
jgi:hypothetical protein